MSGFVLKNSQAKIFFFPQTVSELFLHWYTDSKMFVSLESVDRWLEETTPFENNLSFDSVNNISFERSGTKILYFHHNPAWCWWKKKTHLWKNTIMEYLVASKTTIQKTWLQTHYRFFTKFTRLNLQALPFTLRSEIILQRKLTY